MRRKHTRPSIREKIIESLMSGKAASAFGVVLIGVGMVHQHSAAQAQAQAQANARLEMKPAASAGSAPYAIIAKALGG